MVLRMVIWQHHQMFYTAGSEDGDTVASVLVSY